MSTKFEKRADGLFVLTGGHASFPHLVEPNSFDGDAEKAKFSVNMLFPIESKAYAEFKKAVASIMPKGAKPDASKLPFKEAKSVPESWQDKHGVSAYTVKFVNKKPITVYGTNGLPVAADAIKGGDIIAVAFEPFWFESKFGWFCQLQARAVLKISDDLDFGGGGGAPADASVFGIKPSSPFVETAAETDGFEDSEIPF